jgi:hypothetical protein
MSASSDRARDELIHEYRQRAAVKLTNRLVEVGHQAGLTDAQILDSVYDRQVRRLAERNLGMRVRSDTTWQFVLEMLPGALKRARVARCHLPADPFTLMGI